MAQGLKKHLLLLMVAASATSTTKADLFDFLEGFSSFNHEMREQVRRAWKQEDVQGTQEHALQQENALFSAYYSPLHTNALESVKGTLPQEIYDLRDYLAHQELFAAAGAQGPRGILLVGPPGTGKTSVTRALAAELGIPIIVASGSSFVEKYVGVGAQRVRELFAYARQLVTKLKAPHIILFIDELDAIGTRDNDWDSPEARRTINELLVQMDGFRQDLRIIVIGATNRADLIDPALKRPGRFDYVVTLTLPDLASRIAIMEYYLHDPRFKRSCQGQIALGAIAEQTKGYSGADLEALVNRAAINATRHERTTITQQDLEQALTQMQRSRSTTTKQNR